MLQYKITQVVNNTTKNFWIRDILHLELNGLLILLIFKIEKKKSKIAKMMQPDKVSSKTKDYVPGKAIFFLLSILSPLTSALI